MGFSFAAKGAKSVKTAFQGITGAAGAALEILDGLTGTGQGLAHSIGTVLGGSLSLVVNLFKTVGSTALATGALIASAMALASAGIGAVLGALEFVIKLGPNLAKSMGSALSSVGDQIQQLANAGRDLTTGMESELQQAGVTARQMGGGFGFLGDDLNKFEADVVSMSQKLNIGVSEAAKAHRAWIESATKLQEVGFENETQFQQLNAALGTNADMFRNNVLVMSDSMHLSGAAMSNVIGSLQQLGRETGDVSGALGKLDTIQEMMNRNLQLGGKKLPNEDMAAFATSITGAATAFMKFGQKSDKAVEHAFALGEQLLASRENIADMFAGNSDDLDNFAQELGITLGDIGKAQKLIASGPAGFMEQMALMVQDAKKKGTLTGDALVNLNSRLTKLTGGSKDMAAELMEMFQGWNAGTDEAVKKTREATSTLGKYGAEIHRTGRSMEEEFSRAQDIMFTKFRALGKPEATAWLQRVNVGMRDFGKTMAAFKGDTSPMGQFVNKMSEASSIGAQAFLPKSMQATTVVMGTMLDKMGPTIDMMGKLGMNFTSLSGVATSAAAGLSLWAAQAGMTQQTGESFGSAMARVAREWLESMHDTVKGLADWFGQIAKSFAEFDWAALFSGEGPKASVTGGIDELWAYAQELFKDVDFAGIAANLRTGFEHLWDAVFTDENKAWLQEKATLVGQWIQEAITTALMSIPWGKVLGSIYEGTTQGVMDYVFGSPAENYKRSQESFAADKKAAEEFNSSMAKSFDISSWFGGDDKLAKNTKQVSSALASAVVLPVERVSAQSEQIMTSMDNILSTVKENHEHSMNTYIGDDMAKAVDLTETQSQAMIRSLENITLSGQDLFARMWYGIAQDTESAVNQISQIAERLVSNLEQIAVMKATIADAASQPSDRFAVPAANEERNRRIEQLVGDKAVHSPLWYEGAGGYKDLFSTRMDRLIAAVEGLRFQTAPAAAGAAPKAPPKSFVPSPPPGGTKGSARTNSGASTPRRP